MRAATDDSTAAQAVVALSILLQPALILVDNGHFQ